MAHPDVHGPARRRWLTETLRRDYADQKIIDIFEARADTRLNRAGDRAIALAVKFLLIAVALELLLRGWL